ncbi:hypothetical protein [Agrobacterium tumefaciens]|uniref:hypothetical protein n=1 Tax=Agrobacterium tumefaciens TaxID=358 RepID=UPI0015729D8A|nr:hypothetical protein [Agrobacterium tumefaciens]NTD84340.1 hypothetical protein [Agrobacterium tumefaciens]NTD94656.1 hypothetical protein [Agrobacterium tumefaciens]NTE13966.1 hypothetical protein [Agrobacterium tumefaciens]NTE28122.1 hypothetical protein [Agrobacterium tumefaciens]NTE40272.1 hypothetical protein [Agrobacterium tumefaciens]
MTHASRRHEPARSNAREQLPRALVGRRRPTFLEDFAMENADRFKVGDNMNISKPDGKQAWIMILGDKPCGKVEAAFWTGLPQLFETTFDELSRLRVIRVEKMGKEDVEMYRQWVGLEVLQ